MANLLANDTMNRFYNGFLGADGLPSGQVDYQPIEKTARTSDQIFADVAAFLRPTVDQSIKSLRGNTVQQKAALDADAASRGLTSSTYVTDVKSRLGQQEQANMANIESTYSANLAQQVMSAWENQTNRNTQIDVQNVSNSMNRNQFNAQRIVEREQDAYQRALYQESVAAAQAALAGSGSGAGGYDTNRFRWITDEKLAEQFMNATNRSAAAISAVETQKALGQTAAATGDTASALAIKSWRPTA